MKHVRRDTLRTMVKKYIDRSEESIMDWVVELQDELENVYKILLRRYDGEADIVLEYFEFFVMRMIRYKREHPWIATSGDWDLLQRIILNSLKIHEIDEVSVLDLPKDVAPLVGALSRISSQMEKDLKALGGTSKEKRDEQRETLKVVLDRRQQLEQAGREVAVDDWIDELEPVDNAALLDLKAMRSGEEVVEDDTGTDADRDT